MYVELFRYKGEEDAKGCKGNRDSNDMLLRERERKENVNVEYEGEKGEDRECVNMSRVFYRNWRIFRSGILKKAHE